jgi:hypothetical protein
MSMIPIQQRLKIQTAPIRLALKQFGCELRVAIPGIVVANRDGNPFDPVKQTVSVQPAVQEVIRVAAVPTLTTLPICDDVPIQLPRAGGWALTFPIAIGDECLLVFSDMAFDHWWESGGVQKQPDGKLYRHDIGDAVAIFGITSVPRALANYSTTSAQLRSADGSVVVDLATGAITLNAASISALFGSGTAHPLMTAAWQTWFEAYVLPHIATGTIPPPPGPTTIFEAE